MLHYLADFQARKRTLTLCAVPIPQTWFGIVGKIVGFPDFPLPHIKLRRCLHAYTRFDLAKENVALCHVLWLEESLLAHAVADERMPRDCLTRTGSPYSAPSSHGGLAAASSWHHGTPEQPQYSPYAGPGTHPHPSPHYPVWGAQSEV